MAVGFSVRMSSVQRNGSWAKSADSEVFSWHLSANMPSPGCGRSRKPARIFRRGLLALWRKGQSSQLTANFIEVMRKISPR